MSEKKIQIDETTCLAGYNSLPRDAKEICCREYSVCGEEDTITVVKKKALENNDYMLYALMLLLQELREIKSRLAPRLSRVGRWSRSGTAWRRGYRRGYTGGGQWRRTRR